MNALENILLDIYPLSKADANSLMCIFKETIHPNGAILFHQDKTENKLYFIKKVLPEPLLLPMEMKQHFGLAKKDNHWYL